MKVSETTQGQTQRQRICLLIRRLNLGGAQRQLVALARGLDPECHRVMVLTFYPGGLFAEALQSHPHIEVYCLNKRGRWDVFCFLWRAFFMLRRLRPDIIYSFMGGANLLAVFCRPFLGNVKVFWGVRSSGLELRRYPWPERLTAWLEASFSSLPQAILCNAHVGVAAAASRGFPKDKLTLVANGIDGEFFQPSATAGELRTRWGVSQTEIVLGLVGRADPMKDHTTCFLAVRILRQQGIPVRLFLVGYGSSSDEVWLKRQAEDLGVLRWCGWEPVRHDMPVVYSAIDLLVSSSAYGEGFPNVIAEAMACGTPCVATDAGDAALLIGSFGEVVPIRDPAALADGIIRMLERLRDSPELRSAVRSSILERFSVDKMVEQTVALFSSSGAGTSGKG